MSARILSGAEVAAVVHSRVAARVASLHERGKSVGLATVLVGDDPASRIYVANKRRAAESAGIQAMDHNLPADSAQADIERLVAGLKDRQRPWQA